MGFVLFFRTSVATLASQAALCNSLPAFSGTDFVTPRVFEAERGVAS